MMAGNGAVEHLPGGSQLVTCPGWDSQVPPEAARRLAQRTCSASTAIWSLLQVLGRRVITSSTRTRMTSRPAPPHCGGSSGS